VEYRWRAAKINYVFKFSLYLPEERKIRIESYVKEREILLLTYCLRVCLSWNFALTRWCVLTWVTKILMRAMSNVHVGRVPHPWRKRFTKEHNLQQCFSTGVPRNLRVPRVAARVSTETDQNSLGRNSQPQFYVAVAIPLLHRFITESRIDTWTIAWVQWETQTFAEGSTAAKRLKNTDLQQVHLQKVWHAGVREQTPMTRSVQRSSHGFNSRN